MTRPLNPAEVAALTEAQRIAETSAYRSHEIWEGRWLWCFDVPNLFVVADHIATPKAPAVLIVEQAAIHRAQYTNDWAKQALAALAFRETPRQGGVQ